MCSFTVANNDLPEQCVGDSHYPLLLWEPCMCWYLTSWKTGSDSSLFSRWKLSGYFFIDLYKLLMHSVTINSTFSPILQVSLSFNIRTDRSTVNGILKDICEAIWKVLMPQYVWAQASTAEWEGVSHQFEQMWNFPHCIGKIHVIQPSVFSMSAVRNDTGVIDGKHVVIHILGFYQL